MNPVESSFYALLGILSVKFARIEYNLEQIIVNLCDNLDDLIVLSLIGTNTLQKNLDVLVKIDQIKNSESELIKAQISLIKEVKGERNLFIHGVWETPQEDGSQLSAVCRQHRVRFSEVPNEKRWMKTYSKSYSASYLQTLIKKLDIIIASQNLLLKKIDSYL